MRLPPGQPTAEATPAPETAGDGEDDGLLVDTGEAAWDRLLALLDWLGGFALNLLWAAVVVFVIIYATSRIRRRLRRTLERRIQNNLPALLDNIFQILVFIVAGAFALGTLGADSNALVTTIGLVTAAVSLSLQDVLKNFVAGLYLLAEQPFAVGDRLDVSGQVGTVERVNVRTTVLRNDRAEQVLVPNYQVFSQVVTNRTAYRLRTLTITVAGIEGDPEEVLADAPALLAELQGPSGTSPQVALTKIGPEGFDLEVTVWSGPNEDRRREAIRHLRARFPGATVTVAT